jgi:hypothetical protein
MSSKSTARETIARRNIYQTISRSDAATVLILDVAPDDAAAQYLSLYTVTLCLPSSDMHGDWLYPGDMIVKSTIWFFAS